MEYIVPGFVALISIPLTWFFARRNNNAEARLKEIEAEIKAASFYKSLLDDAKTRLEEAITAINERDIRIRERDKHIEALIIKVELLTTELGKYKQLNGKKD